MIESHFTVAAASVAGRHHTAAGRNNQDAAHVRMSPQRLVALVCDGCSSSPHAEVGAYLGARLLAEHLLTAPSPWDNPVAALEAARAALLERLAGLSTAMGADPRAVVEEAFLFTVVGAVLGVERGITFAAGDGVIAVNGELDVLGPFPGNAPPYPGLALLSSSVTPPLSLHRELETSGVQSLVLGSDGVVDLIDHEDRCLPGRDEMLGPLSQFWTVDRYHRNPDAMRRRLVQAARDVWTGEGGVLRRESGLLPDDTTLVVLRRRPAGDPLPDRDRAERGSQWDAPWGGER